MNITTAPKRYTSNPITIEAAQWDGTAEGATTLVSWALSHDGSVSYQCLPDESGDCPGREDAHYLSIVTLEGKMMLTAHGWLIRGTKGEFYPVRDDIFREKYHLANDHTVES